MDIRKLAAMGLSVLFAVAVLLPAPALAEQSQPNAQYGSGEGSGSTTELTLVAQDPDANLASNGGSAWVAQHAKVQVPVAINFVVTGTGDIEGPSAAAITNYSSFPVSVSNIKVTASSGVTFASTSIGAIAADQVYLQFQPGANTTPVNLSQFAGTNGAAPTLGEWNIGAGSASAGTSLSLTGFSGHVGGFGSLDPLSREEFATIAWTIKAGSAQSVTLPSSLAAASASDLQAAGDAIRNGDVTVKAHYDNLVGQAISTTIGNGSGGTKAVAACLVDVSYEKGLVFMFEQPIVQTRMNPTTTNAGGWVASELRSSMNSGSVYAGYLGSMTISGVAVTPATVTNSSLDYNGGDPQVITSEDKYWLPSVVEIFGAWQPERGYSGNEGCTQFAYYRSQGFTASGSYSLVQNYGRLWLRSAAPHSGQDSGQGFMGINDDENGAWGDKVCDGVTWYNAHVPDWVNVRPCFAL